MILRPVSVMTIFWLVIVAFKQLLIMQVPIGISSDYLASRTVVSDLIFLMKVTDKAANERVPVVEMGISADSRLTKCRVATAARVN